VARFLLQKTERWEKTSLPDFVISGPIPVCTARFQRALLFLGYKSPSQKIDPTWQRPSPPCHQEAKTRLARRPPATVHSVAAKRECPEISVLLRRRGRLPQAAGTGPIAICPLRGGERHGVKRLEPKMQMLRLLHL
jgi:hypothetical protein